MRVTLLPELYPLFCDLPPFLYSSLLIAKHRQGRKKGTGTFILNPLNAGAVAGPGAGDVNERAAWTALARALLNLDEMIVKE